jgi:hypothetical protein
VILIKSQGTNCGSYRPEWEGNQNIRGIALQFHARKEEYERIN